MKAASITAFVNDSIKLRVAVYDDLGEPFDITESGLYAALYLGKDIYEAVEVKANVCEFFIPSGVLNEVQTLAFYVALEGREEQYTVAFGTISVKDPKIIIDKETP